MTPTPEQQLAQALRRTADMLDSHGDHVHRHLAEVRDGALLRAQALDGERVTGGNSTGPDWTARLTDADRAQDRYARWSFGIGALTRGVAVTDPFLIELDPRPSSRPSATRGACLGTWTHAPDIDGRLCTVAHCRKPWPCDPAETVSRVEECTGTIDPATNRCRRCELGGDSMVCRDCGEVRPRDDGRNGICGTCRKRRTRAQEVA